MCISRRCVHSISFLFLFGQPFWPRSLSSGVMASEQANNDANGSIMTENKPDGNKQGPEAHFEYFKQWYSYMNEYAIVQKARAGYDAAKHSSSFAENALSKFENGVHTGLTGVAAPVYANYCYPATDRLVDFYSKSLDTTKVAMDKTVSAATHTGTLSVGLALVTAQMGLIATTSATNLLLSSLIYTKHAGDVALQGVQSAEKAVEQRIRETLEHTQQLAKVPADKLADHTNTFLDIANAVFDKILGLPHESESPDSSIADRIRFLSRRVTGGLINRTNDVIDPVKARIHDFVQQMNRKIILADYVKQRREWISEKTGSLTNSVREMRDKIETEAKQYSVSPEAMLIRSIHATSMKLNENFEKLRTNGQQLQLIGENAAQKLDAATTYVQQLDNNFAKAEKLDQIRDEVIVEAKQKFNDMAQWTASFLVRDFPDQQSTASAK